MNSARAIDSSLVHASIHSAEPAQVHVVGDDDLAVRRHPHVELEHLRPALVDRAPEALQGVLVGLGRPAAVRNVNVAAPPLHQCVDSKISSKGCMNSTRLAPEHAQRLSLSLGAGLPE